MCKGETEKERKKGREKERERERQRERKKGRCKAKVAKNRKAFFGVDLGRCGKRSYKTVKVGICDICFDFDNLF